MLAPQGDNEIAPVLSALRLIDPLLSVIWNPKAVMVGKGSYTALGVATPPAYDGRWQVIRYDTHHWSPTRDYCLICTVTETIVVDGIRCLVAGGKYAPVGPWLVEFMQAADAQNVRTMTALRKKLWAQDDALDNADESESDAMFIDALDKTHFDAAYAGGVGNWQGKGMDFTPPKE